MITKIKELLSSFSKKETEIIDEDNSELDDACASLLVEVAFADKNFDETENVANNSNCPVIISGGVSSINDIKKAKELGNINIEGIIVGKAIYDGDIKLDELAKEIDA